MPEKQKRTPNRFAGARALYATVNAIGLAAIGSALGFLFTNPSPLAFLGTAVLILNIAVFGFVAAHRLHEIEYEERHADSEQQTQDTKEAVKQGMLEALREILQNDAANQELKEAVRDVIREELAHANLADKEGEPTLLEVDEDIDTDTSQQKH